MDSKIGFKLIGAAAVVGFTGSILLTIGGIWIICHFVAKFW